MRRIVLAAATIIGLTVPVLGQSATMVQIPSLGGRTLFVVKPPTETAECPSLNVNAITPWVVPRLGRTILADALVYSLVGVVFFLVFQDPVYRNLGLIDLVFFIPEVLLLTMAVRAAGAAPAPTRAHTV